MTKSELRNYMKEIRKQLSYEEKRKQDSSICEKLYLREEYQDCESVLIYISFQSEIDTKQMISDMLKEGKEIYVPKVTDKRIEFFRIYGFDFLKESKFGILEPDITWDLSCYYQTTDRKALMILPGLAFDPWGNRIGYGAGYYDRYLNEKKSDHFNKIALSYDFQIVEKIEAMNHDVRADIILTPTRVYQCNSLQIKEE